ncbi:hypothetical protein BH11PLA1_BH11PLA1_05630 [soil metagenome]
MTAFPPGAPGPSALPAAVLPDSAALAPDLSAPRAALSPWRAFRRPGAFIGLVTLCFMVLACLLTLPWTIGAITPAGYAYLPDAERPVTTRVERQFRGAERLPPTWFPHDPDQRRRADALARSEAISRAADARGVSPESIRDSFAPTRAQIDAARPLHLLGTDVLGRDALARTLAGGAISLLIGLAAAAIAVAVGTAYGTISGYFGGTLDDAMMRIVDILYGLPYVLLIVLLAVASDALVDEFVSRAGAKEAFIRAAARTVAVERGWETTDRAISGLLSEDKALYKDLQHRADLDPAFAGEPLSPAQRTALDLLALLIAIGALSWLTLARVVRGQVLSLKSQPFMDAARVIGVPLPRIFRRHLLPNLAGPIVVYATLTVPQAILQESFLSFLGIGVKPPIPSWGNLAADGLGELNTVHSNWWLLVFPCLLLALTLLSLNLVGEGLREAIDPKRSAH